ncbi:hypothetical protein D3C72_2146720 [compost metagenome]
MSSVPLMTPVLGLSVRPAGRPVAVYVSTSLLSTSVKAPVTSIGVMTSLSLSFWSGI